MGSAEQHGTGRVYGCCQEIDGGDQTSQERSEQHPGDPLSLALPVCSSLLPFLVPPSIPPLYNPLSFQSHPPSFHLLSLPPSTLRPLSISPSIQSHSLPLTTKGLHICGQPHMTIITIGSSDPKLDVFAVADLMETKGTSHYAH